MQHPFFHHLDIAVSKRTSAWIWVIVALAAAGLIGAWLYRASQPEPKPAMKQTPAPAPASTAPAIKHPISEVHPAPASSPAASASTAPAPLDGSDTTIAAELDRLTGGKGLKRLLVSRDIIQRLVATVDALPRRTVNANVLPVRSPHGQFMTETVGGKTVISERNAARYAPYMRLIEAVDTDTAVAWYVRHYPLFQSAYEQLGYPKRYFNDRVVFVIDQLLATPDARPPVTLERPNVFYTYADTSLEALSAGQKMLLRAGPDDEKRIKAKLRAIRSALTDQPLAGQPVH